MKLSEKMHNKWLQKVKKFHDHLISSDREKAINKLLNKRSKSSNIDSLKESGSETVHKKDIFYTINSFFCSVGKDLADKIDPAPNPLLAGDYEINKHKARFNFRIIEVQEIRDAFATVKAAKSFGTNNISSYI